ncbi:MAG: hypothetical protein AB7G87_06115 [Clostridia bacterium]
MSVKNLFMMIFMVVFFPAMIIFCNIDAFFLIMSVIIILLSLGSIRTLIISSQAEIDEEELEDEDEDEDGEESFAEVGEALGIDARRLNYGFIIAMNLVIIIYFLYTFFITDILLLKAVAIILIADWIYDLIGVIDNMLNIGKDDIDGDDDEFTWKDRLYELYLWMHDIVTIIFIAGTFFFKYIK